MLKILLMGIAATTVAQLLSSPPSYANKRGFCFVQLFSTKDVKRAERVFNTVKLERPYTLLLKYGEFFTVRIGPFKDDRSCKKELTKVKLKYKSLHLNPITIHCPNSLPPEKRIVKIHPQRTNNSQKNTSKNKKEIVVKAKKSNFKDYLLYLEKAKVCMGKRDCTNAIKYLKLAIQKKPNNPLLYVYLGYAYAHIGDYTKALESFKKALQINPLFAEGYTGLGYLYLQLNAPKAAALAFKKAHEIDPKDIIPAVNYAVALLECGEYQKSLEVFQSLKEKYPFLPEIYFNESLVLIKAGNLKSALSDLQLFLDMTKGNKNYKSYRNLAINLIEQIKKWTQKK